LRVERVAELLGVEVDRAQAEHTLEALGFKVTDFEVVPPHWRVRDVTREVDVIEEVARLVALDVLPATLPANRTGQAAALDPRQRARRGAADALVGAGLLEVAGWSFTAPDTAAKLGLPGGGEVVLENPMSEDLSVLRTTLVGSLLDVAAYNQHRGASGVALF